jgi:molybdopterin/thiamine biosynthesis adenylyltransferase
MEKYRIRQSGIIPEIKLKGFKVGIVGCGAIGSQVANALARMGVRNFVLFDPDIVSHENISCQGFYPSDINKRKAAVVCDDILAINHSAEVLAHEETLKYHHGTDLKGCDVIISSVDNMATRQEILDLCLVEDITNCTIIDPRMGAEKLVLCVVDVDYYASGEAKWYRNMLFPDDKAIEEPCTAKSTIYTTQLISGLVCKAVKDRITNYENPALFISWDVATNKIVDYTLNEGGW